MLLLDVVPSPCLVLQVVCTEVLEGDLVSSEVVQKGGLAQSLS